MSSRLCYSNGETSSVQMEYSHIYRKHVRTNLITNSQAIQFILISLWLCTKSACNCFSASLDWHSQETWESELEEARGGGRGREMHGVAVSLVSWHEVRSCRSNCHTITAFITHQHANKAFLEQPYTPDTTRTTYVSFSWIPISHTFVRLSYSLQWNNFQICTMQEQSAAAAASEAAWWGEKKKIQKIGTVHSTKATDYRKLREWSAQTWSSSSHRFSLHPYIFFPLPLICFVAVAHYETN